ncbi:MAG: diguanylate cyclase [Cellvibrionaceae bacterium]
MNQIQVRELMTCEVLSLTPEAPLAVITQQMSEQRRSCVVIVEDDHPVGIVTERDMVGVLARSLPRPSAIKLTAADFMSSPPVCISDGASLYEALVITQARGIRHLPVIDEQGALLGLLSQGDIARAHFRAIEQQREIIEQQIDQRTSTLVAANEQLKALSLQDALTGIGNRRAMEVDINFTHSNANRYQRPYCVALLDVDFFKKYNDHYGHPAEDSALRELVEYSLGAIRLSDRLYRYGGEEFLLLLPETTLEEASTVVARVLSEVEAAAIEHCKSPFGHLTLSAGICMSDLNSNAQSDEKGWQLLIQEADERLYRAKSSGRNQLCADS